VNLPDQNLASAVGYGHESWKEVSGDETICSMQIQHCTLQRVQSSSMNLSLSSLHF